MSFSAMFGHRNYPWYLVEGIGSSCCVAAYAPILASNISGSYVNYANPGTYTASNPGATPAWNTTNGWVCNAGSYVVAGASLATAYKPGYGDSILNQILGMGCWFDWLFGGIIRMRKWLSNWNYVGQ